MSALLAAHALVALGPVVLRRRRTLVVVVAALALLRGLVWAASIPQLEAMDEPARLLLAGVHSGP